MWRKMFNIPCIFCNHYLTPEATGSDYDGWLFQCDYCGGIWESIGKQIPKIEVKYRPNNIRWELNFDDDE